MKIAIANKCQQLLTILRKLLPGTIQRPYAITAVIKPSAQVPAMFVHLVAQLLVVAK